MNYTAATGAFAASGVALQISVDASTTFNILAGSFTIGITTDGTTTSGVGGDDLSIVGGIDINNDGIADASGTLLTGEIAQFGSSSTGPGVFEFVFDVTGGLLTTGANPPFNQSQAGVILGADGNSTYTGSFASDFSNLIGGQAGSGSGSADTSTVPEPTTLLLLGSGIAGLAGFGRRRGRSPSGARVAMMLVGLVVTLAVANSASATLLGNPVSFPLLSFDNGGVMNYDATADTFQVLANPIALRGSPGTPPVFVTPNPPDSGEFFVIDISVDSSGNLVGGSAGDDLSVFGSIDLNGDGTIDVTGSLLTGEVTGFGFQENGATDLYDFSFTVTGGQLAGAFGSTVGVGMQSERSTFTGSFEDNFHGGAKGTLGTIPEPTTLLLLGSGVVGLALAGRKREA